MGYVPKKFPCPEIWKKQYAPVEKWRKWDVSGCSGHICHNSCLERSFPAFQKEKHSWNMRNCFEKKNCAKFSTNQIPPNGPAWDDTWRKKKCATRKMTRKKFLFFSTSRNTALAQLGGVRFENDWKLISKSWRFGALEFSPMGPLGTTHGEKKTRPKNLVFVIWGSRWPEKKFLFFSKSRNTALAQLDRKKIQNELKFTSQIDRMEARGGKKSVFLWFGGQNDPKFKSLFFQHQETQP